MAGQVFEKYRRDPGAAIVNDGGELHLKAGPIHVEWSLGGEKAGWIYYDPDIIRVQIVSSRHFEKLDLQRCWHRAVISAQAVPLFAEERWDARPTASAGLRSLWTG